jgi:biotin synthase
MPCSHVRLSAGRNDMSDAVQALCFLAGANSIFYGEKLLTTPNPGRTKDHELFARLGLQPEAATAAAPAADPATEAVDIPGAEQVAACAALTAA